LPTEIALARRLFADARTAEEAKDWAGAAAKLRDAIAIKETAGLRFHLAYCEEQQGMLVEALVDYERSEDLPALGSEDFRAQLPLKKDSLHRRIPTVTLVMPPEPPNTNLTVDGHPLPSTFLGKPIPLNPGRHTLVVSAPDYVSFSTDLSLNETDAVVTNAVMPPVAKSAGVSALPGTADLGPESDGKPGASSGAFNPRTIVLLGGGVVTLAGLAVGIGYTHAASLDDETVDSARAQLGPSTMACQDARNTEVCNKLQRALSEGQDDRFIARLGFIGAGVGLAATIGTLILWPKAGSKTAIAPLLAPSAAGLSVAGRF
jgi:hypothetical protein